MLKIVTLGVKDLNDDGTVVNITGVRTRKKNEKGGGGGRTRTREVGEAVLELARRLREARESSGLTQLELAERAGYSNGWISSVERGVAVPSELFMRRCELVLGQDLGCLGSRERTGRKKAGDVGDWGMTVTETAAYIGLSRTLTYVMVRDGDIPHVICDGFRRVRIDVLSGWMCKSSEAELVNREEASIRRWLSKYRKVRSDIEREGKVEVKGRDTR